MTAATSEVEPSEINTGTGLKRPDYSGDKGEYPLNMVRDTPVEKMKVAPYSYGPRLRIARLHDNYEEYLDHVIQVCGWARTTREAGKAFMFIELYDGSCDNTLQIVVDATMPNYADVRTCKVSASFRFKGKLIRSQAKGQKFELQVCHPESHEAHIFGKCDAGEYPISKKKHTDEFLRQEVAHLRPRTRKIASVARVRNNLAYATHKFFQERGF